MNLNGDISTGCTVHLPKAQEGDFVVCVNPQTWSKISKADKSLLSPSGRIDFVSREKLRQAVVHWNDDHANTEKHDKEVSILDKIRAHFGQALFVLLVAMALQAVIESKAVAYCDVAAGKRKAWKAYLLFTIAIMGLVSTVLPSSNLERANQWLHSQLGGGNKKGKKKDKQAAATETNTEPKRASDTFPALAFDSDTD